MSSQGHSSDGCSDSEDFESPEGDNSQSDPDQPRREETHSNLSTIWGFEGTMQMDLNPEEWDHSDMPDKDDLVAHFATRYRLLQKSQQQSIPRTPLHFVQNIKI